MSFSRGVALTVFIFLSFSQAYAQSGGRARTDGTIGAGVVQNSVQGPATGAMLNSGLEFNVQAEKPLGASPFYLVFSGNYVKGSGTLNYNYISPTASYAANGVNFALDEYRADMGLRLKIFDDRLIRPYIEGGGMAGYMQFSYDSSLRTPAVIAAGSDYRTFEGVLEFGYYAEAGLELQMGSNWGVRGGYHYLQSSSKSISTFKGQTISYTGAIYYGGLFWGL